MTILTGLDAGGGSLLRWSSPVVTPPPSGPIPIHSYLLNNNALDSAGTAHLGINGSPEFSIDSVEGSHSFNSTSGYLELSSGFQPTGTAYSIHASIKRTGTDTGGILARYNVGIGQRGMSLIMQGSAVRWFNSSNGSYNSAQTCDSGALNLNQWYRVVATWQAGTIHDIYIDGVLSNSASSPASSSFLSSEPFSIGRYKSKSSYSNFQGLIDNVQIYDQVVTP